MIEHEKAKKKANKLNNNVNYLKLIEINSISYNVYIFKIALWTAPDRS